MHINSIISHSISKNLAVHGIRKTKINALCDMTRALLSNADLTLTSLGRHLDGDSLVKHKIKRVDRWLDNEDLYSQIPIIYKSILSALLNKAKELTILVDWSGCCGNEQYCLRASVAYDGRSIPIYQEIHPDALQGNQAVQELFLDKLDAMLPKSCKVIIVTDRGFGNPWFTAVRRHGWDFVGRINSYVKYENADGQWDLIKTLYPAANSMPKYIGEFTVSKTTPTTYSLYSYKANKKNRHSRKIKNKVFHSRSDDKHRESNTSPWILATSFKGCKMARRVKNLYSSRMQIEQNFRDDKSERFGFSFRFSRSKGPKRLSVLYLIAAIATYISILIGTAAENLNIHRTFQANTIRNRRVLSLIYLSRQVIRHSIDVLTNKLLVQALKSILGGITI